MTRLSGFRLLGCGVLLAAMFTLPVHAEGTYDIAGEFAHRYCKAPHLRIKLSIVERVTGLTDVFDLAPQSFRVGNRLRRIAGQYDPREEALELVGRKRGQ